MVSAPASDQTEKNESPSYQYPVPPPIKRSVHCEEVLPEPMDTYETDPGEDIDLQSIPMRNLNSSNANIEKHVIATNESHADVELPTVLANPCADMSLSMCSDDIVSCEVGDTLQRAGERMVTMTGTLRRGKTNSFRHSKKPIPPDPNDEIVEIQIRLSDAELMRLNNSNQQPPQLFREAPHRDERVINMQKGPHITLWTTLCMPIIFLMSTCVAFYYGAITWYNVYLYITEEASFWKRIVLGPILVLSFPFLIATTSLGLGTYSAIIQLSWFLPHWYQEVSDLEKGFHGWLCAAIRLPECSPCQIVILDDDILGIDPYGEGTSGTAVAQL